MAILLDPKGLLWGKRLRKLSLKPRLYYPLILGITNFYARIELDGEAILHDLGSFPDPDLTADNIVAWFKEYEAASLLMLYPADPEVSEPVIWAQFDTPLALRRQQPTNEDNASPVPPEPGYTDWLKALHGAAYKDFHMTQYRSHISEVRAEAGRRGAEATNFKRWGSSKPESESTNDRQKSATVGKGRL